MLLLPSGQTSTCCSIPCLRQEAVCIHAQPLYATPRLYDGQSLCLGLQLQLLWLGALLTAGAGNLLHRTTPLEAVMTCAGTNASGDAVRAIPHGTCHQRLPFSLLLRWPAGGRCQYSVPGHALCQRSRVSSDTSHLRLQVVSMTWMMHAYLCMYSTQLQQRGAGISNELITIFCVTLCGLLGFRCCLRLSASQSAWAMVLICIPVAYYWSKARSY